MCICICADQIKTDRRICSDRIFLILLLFRLRCLDCGKKNACRINSISVHIATNNQSADIKCATQHTQKYYAQLKQNEVQRLHTVKSTSHFLLAIFCLRFSWFDCLCLFTRVLCVIKAQFMFIDAYTINLSVQTE